MFDDRPLAKYQVTVAPNGRVVLPKPLREALGICDGGEVFIEQHELGVVLQTREQRIAKVGVLATNMLQGHNGDLVDDLIADRRAEARRDAGDAAIARRAA